VSSLVQQRHSLMFRPRSYMAFAITPQPPIVDWLSELDASLKRSDGFFAGQHVALDLSAVNLSSSAIGQLVASLEERNIRVLGIEGVDPAKWQPGLPPVLRGDRALRTSEPPQFVGSAAPTLAAIHPTLQKQQPASLMIEDPVRSGQSVVFMEGDVTILGSVGSGTEIVAGAARPRASGRHRKCPRSHLLPPRRGRTSCDRLLLQNGRRDRGQPALPTCSGLARGRDVASFGDGLG
jgi:hypothetical protein